MRSTKPSGSPRAPVVRIRSEPRRLLVAQSIGCQHREVRVGRRVKVEDSVTFSRDGANVPARRINTDHFAGREECSRLGWIASAGGSPAQAPGTAGWGPVPVVSLVRFFLAAEAAR